MPHGEWEAARGGRWSWKGKLANLNSVIRGLDNKSEGIMGSQGPTWVHLCLRKITLVAGRRVDLMKRAQAGRQIEEGVVEMWPRVDRLRAGRIRGNHKSFGRKDWWGLGVGERGSRAHWWLQGFWVGQLGRWFEIAQIQCGEENYQGVHMYVLGDGEVHDLIKIISQFTLKAREWEAGGNVILKNYVDTNVHQQQIPADKGSGLVSWVERTGCPLCWIQGPLSNFAYGAGGII